MDTSTRVWAARWTTALKPPSIHDVEQHRAVDIQADEAGSFRHVRPQAAAQVVDDEDVVPHRQQLAYEMRTNKSGAAGNEYVHNAPSFP